MHRSSVAVGFCFAFALVIGASSTQARAETAWSATGGQAYWGVSSEVFAELGITVKLNGADLVADETYLTVTSESAPLHS